MLRRAGPPLLAAFACLIGLAITGVVAYLSHTVHGHDSVVLDGFVGLQRPRVDTLAAHVVHLADPGSYLLLGLALIALAVAGGRRRAALAIVPLLVLTGATTETLKALIAHPRSSEWLGHGDIVVAAWPSGHATAAMTLALCAVLAVPARWRPTAAVLGGAFAVAVAYALLVLAWHFPLDVIGGFLVAAAWTLAAVAALRALEARWPSRPRRDASPALADRLGPVAVTAAVGTAVMAMVAAQPGAVDYALGHRAFVAGAIVIATLGLALAGGVARGVGR